MNVLCINPWIYDFTAYDFWLKPLGLLSAAALLRSYTNCDCRLIDCLDRSHPSLPSIPVSRPDGRGHFFKQEVPKPDVLRGIPRRYSRYGISLEAFRRELNRGPRPDLVLMTSGMTYWYPGVQHAIALVRERFGCVPVILGGIYASLMPDHARAVSGADAVCIGPAEKSLFPLIRELLGDGGCPGAVEDRWEDLPLPAYDLLNDRGTLPLLTSRGCPFDCSFCAGPRLYPGFAQTPPGRVVELVTDLCRRFGTRQFAFYDDSLLVNKHEHFMPLMRGLIHACRDAAFHTPNGLHVREIDRPIADLLWKAGVKSLFLSQESFEPDILRRSCSKVAPGDLENALKHLRAAGFLPSQIRVYLLAGLPRQSLEGIRESIRRVQSLGLRPFLAYFSPVPGTRDWSYLVEKRFLAQDADPLLHNKLVFPYTWWDHAPEDFDSLNMMLVSPRSREV